MKSKVLALLTPVLFAADVVHAAEVYNKSDNKLDLYDKIDGLYYFSDDSAKGGDQSYARLGSKGEAQVNGQPIDYGQWEYNIQADNTESSTNQPWTRLVFVGLKFADRDSFDYGCNYGVMYDVEGWTGILSEFDGDSYTNADNFTAGRTSGVAIYRNTDFFSLVNGLNFAVQYQDNNEGASNGQEGINSGRDVRRGDGDGWDLSTTYDLGTGFSAGATCISSDRTNDQVNHTTTGGDKTDARAAGLKYDASNVYLATMYLEMHSTTLSDSSDYVATNKTQDPEVTAQYQSDFNLRLAVSFLMSKGRNLHAAGGVDNPTDVNDKDLVRYANVGATYYFNKNISIYVDYEIDLLDEDDGFCAVDGIFTDDTVALSLVYQF